MTIEYQGYLRVSNPRTVIGPDPGAAFEPGAALSGVTLEAVGKQIHFMSIQFKRLKSVKS